MVISCLPCGDMEDCKIEENEKIAIAETNHTEHQEDSETCSPFCICACCGTTMVSSFLFPTLISETSHQVVTEKGDNLAYHNSFISDFYGNIWQPPKI